MAGYLEFPHNLRSNYGSQKADEEGKEIRFMNYVPTDKELRNYEPPTGSNRLIELEGRYNQVQREITTNFLKDDMNQAMNILPKKPNVDLKRNLAKRLERLNKRTELAIYDLLSSFISEDFELNLGFIGEKVSNLEVGGQTSTQQMQVETPFVSEKDLKKKVATKTISSNKFAVDESEQIEDFDEEADETGGQNLVEKIKLQENIARKQDKELADDEEESSESDSD